MIGTDLAVKPPTQQLPTPWKDNLPFIVNYTMEEGIAVYYKVKTIIDVLELTGRRPDGAVFINDNYLKR